MPIQVGTLVKIVNAREGMTYDVLGNEHDDSLRLDDFAIVIQTHVISGVSFTEDVYVILTAFGRRRVLTFEITVACNV